VLRIDNGRDLYGNEFEEFCKKYGIQRQKNIPYTPQQNGVAERMNRTLMEK
jgi:transposase InsO family protein